MSLSYVGTTHRRGKNSLAVTIPPAIVKALDLQPGENLQIIIKALSE